MPAKLQIPKREQGQDDAQYAQSISKSIKAQRPYLTDDEVNSLSNFEISSLPKAPKPQPIKSTTDMIGKLLPNQKSVPPKAVEPIVADVKPKEPILQDPNRAADAARTLEKFIIPQQAKKPIELVGEVYNEEPIVAQPKRPLYQSVPQQVSEQPINPNLQPTLNVNPSTLTKNNEDIKQYLQQKAPPIVDAFDVEAEKKLPQGSKNEKLLYADALRKNSNTVADFEAEQASKDIDDKTFNKAIQRDFIDKQDRGFVLEQKFGGFKDEINKSIRDYMDAPQFKPDVVRISKEQGVSLSDAAQIALDRKGLEYANAPSALEAKMQKFSDWAATNSPLTYVAAKTATSGIKGLTDVGAFGAALIEASVNSTQNLAQGYDANFGNEFARRNAAIQRASRVAIPQVQSEKASAFTQGVSDVTSIVSAIGAPMAAVPQLNMLTKAKNLLSFGRGGEKALQQGLSAQAQLAARTTTNANKLALSLGEVLQSKPANVTAKILDNTTNNYMIMGSPTMDGQRQKYLSLGFSEEEANRRASGMTFLTNLALAMPNVLRPNEMSIMNKVFNTGGFKEGMKAATKQGVHFGVDMTALRATEEALDNQALRERGVEVEEKPFEEQLSEKLGAGAKDFAAGMLMSAMGRMKYRQSDMQLAGIAESYNNPEALNESIKNSVRSGKVSKENAVAFQTFLNTLKPEYDKALNETRKDGTPKFAPTVAAKVAIERTKQKQAEQTLQELENSTEKWTTYEKDKDGNQVEKTLYRHTDGKMYDYPEPRVQRQKSNLLSAVMDARKTVAQLESGQYVKGKLVSANQMKAIVEMNSLNGEAKKGQLEAIDQNAPYENVEFEVVEFAKQPEIAKRVEEIKASGETPTELPSANDPILNDKGEVVEGRTQVAHAIIRGGGKITFMKPLSPEKAAEAVNISLGEKIGETQPIIESLGETDVIAINEMQDVYSKHLEANEGDFNGAMNAAAKDAIERQYTEQETKDMLKRMNGGDALSQPLIDYVYREASKETKKDEQPTENKSEGERVIEVAEAVKEVPKEPSVDAASGESEVSPKQPKEPKSEQPLVEVVPQEAPKTEKDGEVRLEPTNERNEPKAEQEKGRGSDANEVASSGNERNDAGDKGGVEESRTSKIRERVKQLSEELNQAVEDITLKNNKNERELTENERKDIDAKNRQISKKVTGQKKKRAKAVMKDKRYLKALDIMSPDPLTMVKQYFIGGGTISREALLSIFNNSEKEVLRKVQINGGSEAKNGISLDRLNERLGEDYVTNFGEGKEVPDFREAIQDALLEYNSVSEIAQSLHDMHPDTQWERYEAERNKEFIEENREYEEYTSDAISIFDKLTDAEKEVLASEGDIDALIEAKKYEQDASQQKLRELSDLESSILDKEKQLAREQSKLTTLKAKIEEVGKENQLDIFGNKKADDLLFGTDVSDAEKVVKSQQKVVDGLKSDIAELNEKADKVSDVNPNQIEMELPTTNKASSFLREQANNLREQNQKDLDSNAPKRQGGISKVDMAKVLETIADIIDAGIEVKNKISKLLSDYKESERKQILDEVKGLVDEDYYKENIEYVEPKSEPKEPKLETKEDVEEVAKDMVERTLVSLRLKDSSIDEAVKGSFTYADRMREIDGANAANASASMLIQEVGMDEAVSMAKEGKIKGALQSAVLGAKWLEADANLQAATTPEEKRIAQKEYSEILEYIGKTQETSGAANAYWATFYATNDGLGVTTEDRIKRWEKISGGVASSEIREAYEKLSTQNAEQLAEIKELRAIKESESYNEFLEYLKSGSKPKDPKAATKKAKEVADKFRTALKSKPIELKDAEGNTLLDADGKPIVLQMQGLNFNELIEVGAKAIEKTGEIIDGVKAIGDKLAEQDWYKSLSKKDKDAVLSQITKSFEQSVELPEVDTTREVSIDVLRDLVSKGYNTPELLLQKLRDFYPNKTDRFIRDKLSKYAEEAKETRPEIDQKISAIKSIWAKISQIEDAKGGKMPFRRSPPENKQFRDERRRKMNELREAMKNLDVPEAEMEAKWKSRIESAKTRYKNAIADMEKAIKDGEVIVKNKAVKLNDAEIKRLQEEYDNVKDFYDEAFGKKEKIELEALDRAIDRVENLIKDADLEIKKKPKEQKTLAVIAKREVYEAAKKKLLEARTEAGIIEKEQLRKRAEYLEKRSDYYKDRINRGDFSKTARKKSPTDAKINELLGKNDALKYEYQKLQYLAEEQSKAWHLKRLDNIADIWNIPRIQMATGELSFIGVQGRRLTSSYMLKNPRVVRDAVKTMIKAMGSKKGYGEIMSRIKDDDPVLYHKMKASKVDLTETSFKLKASEENTQRIGGALLWNLAMNYGVVPLAKGYDFITGSDVAAIAKDLKEKPPYEIFERGASAYNNYLRVKAFVDFDAKMQLDGKSFEESEKEYKILADYLNTATGRAKLPFGLESQAELLSKFTFSPRNFETELELATTPFGVGKLAAMQLKSDRTFKQNFTETTAVKEAAKHQIRYTALQTILATSLTGIALSILGSTDDNEDGTGVELDPRSGKFMTITFKNGKIVDMYNGGLRYAILASRIKTKEYKTADKVKMFNDKAYNIKGEVKPLGRGYVPDGLDLFMQIAGNKVNPSLGAAIKLITAKPRTNLDIALGINRDKFGNRVDVASAFSEIMTPIYYNSIMESLDNDPTVIDAVGQLQALVAIAGYRNQNKEKQAREEAEKVKKDIELYNKRKKMGLIK